jgi:hypothetical protein
VINEFMAHCLQQPVSRAAWYFGEVLAGRLYENSWRRTSLPPMDEASGTWPDLGRTFTRETEALSSYVNHRWSFTAGRIRRGTPSRGAGGDWSPQRGLRGRRPLYFFKTLPVLGRVLKKQGPGPRTPAGGPRPSGPPTKGLTGRTSLNGRIYATFRYCVCCFLP